MVAFRKLSVVGSIFSRLGVTIEILTAKNFLNYSKKKKLLMPDHFQSTKFSFSLKATNLTLKRHGRSLENMIRRIDDITFNFDKNPIQIHIFLKESKVHWKKVCNTLEILSIYGSAGPHFI